MARIPGHKEDTGLVWVELCFLLLEHVYPCNHTGFDCGTLDILCVGINSSPHMVGSEVTPHIPVDVLQGQL